MVKTKNKSDSEIQKKREKCKELMRRLREQIKSDPNKYEESKRKERERYYARKATGKIKSINDMNQRDQRRVRKIWRSKFKARYQRNKENQRLETYLHETTPPSTPRSSPLIYENITPRDNNLADGDEGSSRSGSRQSVTGQKIRRKNRQGLNMKIELLSKKLKESEKRARKYRKRYYRLKSKNKSENESSEKKRVRRLVDSLKVDKKIKKRLLFGEILTSQLKENFRQQGKSQDKRKFLLNISGDVIRQYGYTRYLCKIASTNILYSKQKIKNKSIIDKILRAKKLVSEFLTQDDNSRLCPGKRDTITFKKIKKQKRYLNDSLKNLYFKFKRNYPAKKMSYATFCKFRPFWVLQPKVKDRSTCTCISHANISLIISKLKHLKIINEGTSEALVNNLCCTSENRELCLEGNCFKCKTKKVNFLAYNENEYTSYQKWLMKRETLIIKGKEKTCTKTVKERILCTKKELCSILQDSIPKFLLHVRNIKHQYQTIDTIKKNLSTDEILIHVDFSENYVCKYSEEVQSAHFGGSKPQVSLHTVIVYYRPFFNEAIIPLTFCTMSDDLRHDPVAICAHLDLVITEIKKIVPQLTTVHFLSDSPTTQYRNKKMFYLMACYLTKQMNVGVLRWHYSESGHGKGAPDGIGGYIKRHADRLVAQGKDISNLAEMVEVFNGSSKVKVLGLDKNAILKINTLLPINLPTFKGTMKCHEICWCRSSPKVISMRSLSCLTCSPDKSCSHYNLGQIMLSSSDGKNTRYIIKLTHIRNNSLILGASATCGDRLRYEDIYSSSDEEVPTPKEDDGSSDEDIPLRQYYEDKILVKLIRVDSFVVVKLSGKKIIRHYIGKIISIDQDNEYTVSFMKKVGNNLFEFPDKPDISAIDRKDIMKILTKWNIHEFKDTYSFENNLEGFENLY